MEIRCSCDPIRNKKLEEINRYCVKCQQDAMGMEIVSVICRERDEVVAMINLEGERVAVIAILHEEDGSFSFSLVDMEDRRFIYRPALKE